MNTQTNNTENLGSRYRTTQQNKAIHLWFDKVAQELNEAGLDMRVVLKENIPIDWTKKNVKEYLWRPVQEAYTKEHSTTKLTTKDIDKIYDFLNRHLSEKFGLFVQFPSIEELIWQQENEKLSKKQTKRTN